VPYRVVARRSHPASRSTAGAFGGTGIPAVDGAPGALFRPLRDAPPITVQMIWRRHDPHPATHAAVALVTELYRPPSRKPV
jgi:hypothetical protein